MSWRPEQLPANWRRHRILIWSADKSSGTTNNYTVNLPGSISNVVYVDLASSSIVGHILRIDELENAGKTTSGIAYWRFPTELTSTRSAPYPDHLLQPRSINRVTISWRLPSGAAPASTLAEHTIELDIWERVAESGLPSIING